MLKQSRGTWPQLALCISQYNSHLLTPFCVYFDPHILHFNLQIMTFPCKCLSNLDVMPNILNYKKKREKKQLLILPCIYLSQLFCFLYQLDTIYIYILLYLCIAIVIILIQEDLYIILRKTFPLYYQCSCFFVSFMFLLSFEYMSTTYVNNVECHDIAEIQC